MCIVFSFIKLVCVCFTQSLTFSEDNDDESVAHMPITEDNVGLRIFLKENDQNADAVKMGPKKRGRVKDCDDGLVRAPCEKKSSKTPSSRKNELAQLLND